jgi:3D (Asp-Asp-Asp) domain-containing protein
MKGFIIIVAMLFSAASVFALSMSPRPAASPKPIYAPSPAMSARTTPAPRVSISARNESRLARVTVYWASGGKGSDRYTRQHKCATGLRLRDGHCAVDPRRIPYGSRVVLPDGTSLAAVDTGSAVRNRKAARKSGRTATERNALVVDRFFETKREAMAWERTHPMFMPLQVVPTNYQAAQSQPQQARRIFATGNVASSATSTSVGKEPSAVTTTLLASTAMISRNSLNRLGR